MELNQKPLAVEMKQVTKKFGSFTANDRIDFDVRKGEIHALLGENGAGKSTLMNVLYGLYSPTDGEIFIDGKPVVINNPNKAIELGLGMVHQHFMLIEPFTVLENIILGKEITKGVVLDLEEAKKQVEDLTAQYNLSVDMNAKVEDVSVGMQQRVEIIKALYRGAETLILDEPTAVLTPQEIDELGHIVESLAEDGKTIILITHKLKEIKKMADRCTIIRRGKKIATVDVADVTEAELAEYMVGKEVNFKVDKPPKEPGEAILTIEGLWVKDNRKLDKVKGLSLEVRAGEIYGIAGVDGNGQSELIEALTGLRRAESGKVSVRGKDVLNLPPKKIQEAGMYSIPEDRQRRGLVLDFTVAENMILERFEEQPFANRGRLDHKNILDHAERLMEDFDVRPRNPNQLAGELSGGNQQKVIIAREIDNDPEVLIATQPTRGLDVGAIEFVHKYLVDQRNKGKAVLLISFELDEVMALSDRIGVIYDGVIVDTKDPEKTNENELGLLMAGGKSND